MHRNLDRTIFILVFTPIFLIFWIVFYSIPNGLKLSLFFLVGIAILIISFYIFINANHNEDKVFVLKFKGLSENLIKLILLFLILTSTFINPVNGPRTVVLWSRISVLNYLKAIISLIGCAYLPGANLFSIFFPNEKLSKRFKVEPFLLKITIYPILSFCVLGVYVLILDIMGFLQETITRFLIFMILGLVIIDFITQKIRHKKINLNNVNLELSKYSGFVLIFAIGVLFIALGMQFNTKYLPRGDSWVGVLGANFIGKGNLDLFNNRRHFGGYPIFWGYIIYALSVLCGLPFVNTNAFLAPFCYLFVTTSYLLMKAILYESKEKYVALSTIFMSTFSGFSYLFTDYSGEVVGLGIVALCEFYFIYKTFGILLLLLSFAMFMILIRSHDGDICKYRQILFKEDHKYLILTAFFLVISFMIYMIPFLIGVSFSLLFCLFSENKEKSFYFRFFTIFGFYISFFFLLFDNLMFEYLSWIIKAQVEEFFGISIENISENITRKVLIYSMFLGVSILSLILQQVLRILFEIKRISIFKKTNEWFKNKNELFFKVFIASFSIFLIVELGGLFSEKIFGINDLSRKSFFFLFLDYIYLPLGIIGIIGVLSSFYFFRKNQNLYLFLAILILFSFLIGMLILFKTFGSHYLDKPKSLDPNVTYRMRVWFERIWSYSIPSLCIFASYGLFKFVKTINNRFLNNVKKNHKSLLKYITLTFFMFFLFSGLTTAGMWYGSDKSRVNDKQILVIGWVSENLPEDSKIIMERNYNIEQGLRTTTNCKMYYLNREFEVDGNVNSSQNIEKMNDMKTKEIEYLLVSKDYLSDSNNLSKFVKNYLIPDFYYEEVYENDDYVVYYAPYFD